MSRARAPSSWRIFRWPLVLGILSLVGLIAALVGDQAWDVLSWICLGSLPVLLLYYLLRR